MDAPACPKHLFAMGTPNRSNRPPPASTDAEGTLIGLLLEFLGCGAGPAVWCGVGRAAVGWGVGRRALRRVRSRAFKRRAEQQWWHLSPTFTSRASRQSSRHDTRNSDGMIDKPTRHPIQEAQRPVGLDRIGSSRTRHPAQHLYIYGPTEPPSHGHGRRRSRRCREPPPPTTTTAAAKGKGGTAAAAAAAPGGGGRGVGGLHPSLRIAGRSPCPARGAVAAGGRGSGGR